MEKIEKRAKGMIASAFIAEVVMLIFGIVLLVFPETSLNVIRWALAVFFMVIGAAIFARELLRRAEMTSFSVLLISVLTFLLGFVIMTHPNVMNIIPVALGIWIVVSGVFSFRVALSLQDDSFGAYLFTVLSAVASIVLGVILIINPTDSNVALTILLGVVTIAHAALGLVDLLVFRSNLKQLTKSLKNVLKH